MKPREIDVYIEELVLHGFPRSARWQIAGAIENELRARLTKDGVPTAWQSSPRQLDAGSIKSNTHAGFGAKIARAIHGGAL
jgi:hypothetical protein